MKLLRGLADYIQLGTGAISRTFRDVLRETYRATDFTGADAGEQIQAAIDALPSAGGIVDARGLTDDGITATITIDKPVYLKLGSIVLTSSASPVIDITSTGVMIEGSHAPSTFATDKTTKLITSHATGDIIRTNQKNTTVRNVALAASGAKSGGAGIHVDTGGSIVTKSVTIEPCYRGIQMDGGTDGKYKDLVLGADDDTPAAANWETMIYLVGDEGGDGVVTDTSFFHPILSIDRKPSSGAAILFDHGTDSITFWNLEAVTTNGLTNCRSADCGSVVLIQNSDPTNVDPPRTIRFFGGIMESSTANVGIDITSGKDVTFDGTNIDLALIGLRIDEETTLSRNPGNIKFLNGRILATVQQGVLINGSNGVTIRGNVIGDTSYIAASYPAVEVAADVLHFHIDDNRFVPLYGFIDAPVTYPTYFVKIGVGGGDDFTIMRNVMLEDYRATANILDGSTGLNKVIGPNTSDASPYNGMSIYGQYISTLSIGTPPIVVTSTTPATNLNAHAVAYNAAGTQLTTCHLSTTTDVLSAGTKTVTWSGSAAFSNTSYSCVVANKGGTGDVRADIVSSSSVTVTGTGSETFTLWCFGS